ncbi:MAG: N-acetylmuramoyl-L-alanine amidase, partial [Lachnospiraceae bacterium]|nr:N-acetylmuramoyl-L-alanine amidase [Lachnospiraceae bacterium]
FVHSKSTNSKLKEMYNKRKITIDNAEPGILYTCEVTPYRSDSKTTTEMDDNRAIGLRGETGSASEMGRPFAPTKLKAAFNEEAFTVGSVSADAVITWADNSKNSGQSKYIKYMVTRRLYSYNSKTKKYDIQVGGETTLIDKKTTKKVLKYSNRAEEKIPYNTVAEYAVAAVYYNSNDKTIGDDHDGYVKGVEATVRYINPTKIKFDKSSYTVETGSKVDTNVTVSPTPSKTTVNSQVAYRFEVDQYNSSDKKYYLRTDSASIASNYVYMKSDDLYARDKVIPDKYRIYLVAYSKNDPSIRSSRVRVKVTKKETKSSSSSSESSDNSDGSGLVVMLDAGHGGSDSGATSNGVKEKDLTLEYAKQVKAELESRGAKVYMTRSDDTYISLTDRTQKAKDKGCNLFVSLHMNSGGASGTEVYYSVNSSYAKKKLASKLAENISDALGINNRGAKTREGSNGDYYSVIRTSASHGIPGLIVEHGFIDNSTDRSALQGKMEKAASEEARTIVKYWDQ